jgi:hypothetical protein
VHVAPFAIPCHAALTPAIHDYYGILGIRRTASEENLTRRTKKTKNLVLFVCRVNYLRDTLRRAGGILTETMAQNQLLEGSKRCVCQSLATVWF